MLVMVVSPLTEGRGLKHTVELFGKNSERSPLTEGRGLKQDGQDGQDGVSVSPLTEGRGLKRRRGDNLCSPHGVAPHGGAWIETLGF